MYLKICDQCKEKSFSSSDLDWICPVCGEDITDQETRIADVDGND